MIRLTKVFLLAAALAAPAAFAQTDPHAGHHPQGAQAEAAKPETAKPAAPPAAAQNCPSMNGQGPQGHMMGRQGAGPGPMMGGDGKGPMGKGAMGKNGMMMAQNGAHCMMQGQASNESRDQPAPRRK